MSQLTTAAIESAFELEAKDDFVELLELTFPDHETFRFTNQAVERLKDKDGWDREDEYGNYICGIMHKGLPYSLLNFSVPQPEQEGGKPPQLAITIDNTENILTPYIQQLSGVANVVIKLIHTSDPDIVQKSFSGFKLSSADYNENTVSANLGMDYLTNQAYPRHAYTPDWCPGMF